MKKQAKFEVWKGFDWYFRLVAANGEIVLQSEGYTRRIDCLAGIETIKRIAADAQVVKGKEQNG